MSLYSADLTAAIKNAEESLGPSPKSMISTVHLLLGLLRQPQSSAVKEISRKGFRHQELVKWLESRLSGGASFEGGNLWSEEAKRALKKALLIAKESGEGKVRSVHLLTAILSDEFSAASFLLGKDVESRELRLSLREKLVFHLKSALKKE